MYWLCEWCDNSSRASHIINARRDKASVRYCPKCRTKTWHAPMKDKEPEE